MANTFRGPLFSNRREIAPVLGVTSFAVSSLLATLLAGIPLPLSAVHAFPSQVIQQPGQIVQNADTSHGTPKTLTADKQLPFFDAPFFAPKERGKPAQVQNASTATGTPKSLTADKQLPFFDAPFFAPKERGKPAQWLNPSTASGTPKGLTTDQQLPVQVASYFGQTHIQRQQWLNPDTTQDMVSVQRILAAPFVPAPNFVPLKFWWQPPDTTADTPNTLKADAQLPFFVPQQTPPD